MLHMLDTNIVSHLVRQHPEVVNRYSQITPEKMCISSVTEAELLYGVAKKQNNKLHETIMEFLKTITICAWDSEAAATYGELRAAMEKKGKVMGDLDQLIAAHAISRGTTIVTNDHAFGMVQDLTVEDWTTAA
ncbi:type II toxin-antitoxin system VapC family toxin [Enterobacter hormaechei]|uniref:type II toxin-antitoxin system VapC family toxin n=1 Tax=Enterobacter hormaechei TaxID=158836 RepID=UPI00079741DA|nr:MULTISPECIES: type II toxin-antitoxin system VapC family toxin [Enterobacter]MBA7865994.1 type II toxin-antitoxin system VapC family toxin [Enterobacter hormaechei]MCM7509789.1 type II toxin-antitoxin system VapC family toxin [Enterobacter hormaechei]MCW4740844.1 type II toxin-antitoxin system VapC family toxin [Enterobacter hormaechei subsp. hoffmannii]MDU6465102.1 type II toxin-antitoxin system VapC family toxin [Enterobacter sp.]QLP75190.1 type II toxin-antitoxin system VapC family toxin